MNELIIKYHGVRVALAVLLLSVTPLVLGSTTTNIVSSVSNETEAVTDNSVTENEAQFDEEGDFDSNADTEVDLDANDNSNGGGQGQIADDAIEKD